MKYCKFLLIVFTLMIVLLYGSQLMGQDTTAGDTFSTQTDTVAQSDTSKKAGAGEPEIDIGKRGFSTETLIGLIKLSAEIGYFLALVFVLGILFIAQQMLVLNREAKDAQKIPIDKIGIMSYDDIEKMFTHVREDDSFSAEKEQEELQKLPLLKRIFRKKKATAFQLAFSLFKEFKTRGSTASFTEITDSFIQYLKDMFNPFLTRLAFLSDTAGALGLLGTVWGMFMVFYKGDVEQEDILQGMGIAMATTIIGLIISIILNFFTTIVNNIFDRHIKKINRISEIFKERFMKLEKAQPMQTPQIVIDSDALAQMPQRQETVPAEVLDRKSETQKKEVETVQERQVFGPASEIKIIAGDNQMAEVGTELPEPIVIEVTDSKGNPIENQSVIFSAEDGAGTFSNDSRIQKILTDEDGQAQVTFTLSKKAGEKTIQISLDGNNSYKKTLMAIAKPTPATKMVEVDGNYQTGELGKRLEKPFVFAIRDKYDNPIPRYEVNFSLVKGTGKFQDSQNAHLSTYTNENGIVEAFFIMGNNRGAREIEVEAKKVNPSKVNLEIFAA